MYDEMFIRYESVNANLTWSNTSVCYQAHKFSLFVPRKFKSRRVSNYALVDKLQTEINHFISNALIKKDSFDRENTSHHLEKFQLFSNPSPSILTTIFISNLSVMSQW